MDFSDILKSYRSKHNLSQTEMGDVLGISRNYVSEIERGLAINISYSLAVRISSLQQAKPLSYKDVSESYLSDYLDMDKVRSLGLSCDETLSLLKDRENSLYFQVEAVQKQLAALTMRLEQVQYGMRTLHLSFDKNGKLRE